MKPFLILQLRELDGPADCEFRDFLLYGGLEEREVVRIRLEKESIANINPNDYSAIILGGGPSNLSDDQNEKPDHQIRYEAELKNLYPKIFENDIPFLGSCYGFGSISSFAGAEISKEKYSEEVGYIEIQLTEDSKNDPLLSSFPNKFKAFCGHKEASQNMPKNATLLAKSEQCPIQMIRFKKNIYALQFHCELDAKGIAERIRYYKNHGYFAPDEAEKLVSHTQGILTEEAHLILKRFVENYKE